ncbi:MAG: hypothetical protein HYX42_15570 [Polaromonas sp.]|uniref:hypothetical protein n=1 Tax=Polaromonas sp. TaxID=1869339 RepID=UPI0025F193A6|nr:hypothetical protein [Polaromonas sp.]MBI2727658.1 hypothetical protein [Polaromonas sp.]
MDQTQLELDLQMAPDQTELPRKKTAEIVDLTSVFASKQQSRMVKVYAAILESVEHIGGSDKRYK